TDANLGETFSCCASGNTMVGCQTTANNIKRHHHRSNDGDCTDVVPWGGSMAGSRTALGLLALPPGGLVLTSALATGGRRLLTGSTNHGGDPAAAVAGLASVAAAGITAWLTLCLLLALAAELPGAAGAAAGRGRDRITPGLVRRWAAVVLGASVTATLLPGTAVAAAQVRHGRRCPAAAGPPPHDGASERQRGAGSAGGPVRRAACDDRASVGGQRAADGRRRGEGQREGHRGGPHRRRGH